MIDEIGDLLEFFWLVAAVPANADGRWLTTSEQVRSALIKMRSFPDEAASLIPPGGLWQLLQISPQKSFCWAASNRIINLVWSPAPLNATDSLFDSENGTTVIGIRVLWCSLIIRFLLWGFCLFWPDYRKQLDGKLPILNPSSLLAESENRSTNYSWLMRNRGVRTLGYIRLKVHSNLWVLLRHSWGHSFLLTTTIISNSCATAAIFMVQRHRSGSKPHSIGKNQHIACRQIYCFYCTFWIPRRDPSRWSIIPFSLFA